MVDKLSKVLWVSVRAQPPRRALRSPSAGVVHLLRRHTNLTLKMSKMELRALVSAKALVNPSQGEASSSKVASTGVTASVRALAQADLRDNKDNKPRKVHKGMWGIRKATRTPTFTSISHDNNRATGSN